MSVRTIAVDLFFSFRFFLAALVIAVKYFDDLYYDNKFYAHVGGVRVAELDVMEAAFLQLIGRRRSEAVS